MKKIAPIVIVIAILLIIGKIIVAGEVSDLEKDIVESVKKAVITLHWRMRKT